MESIRAAVHAGADAVYAGGRLFGARAYADNPEKDALLEVIDYCHLYGVKLYLTVNTLLKEYELTQMLPEYLAPIYEHGVDAVLVQDFSEACISGPSAACLDPDDRHRTGRGKASEGDGSGARCSVA